MVVARNGKIYFNDASGRFAPASWGGTFEADVLDIIEQRSTGHILEYDPRTRATRVVVRSLSFANGVALSQDEQTLFVAETGKYRVWKVAVVANQRDVTQGSPQATVLLDNLPGYPDNLMRGARRHVGSARCCSKRWCVVCRYIGDITSASGVPKWPIYSFEASTEPSPGPARSARMNIASVPRQDTAPSLPKRWRYRIAVMDPSHHRVYSLARCYDVAFNCRDIGAECDVLA